MSTHHDELGRLLPKLSDAVAGKVLDFARAEQAQEATAGSPLATLLKDPDQAAGLRASLRESREAIARGEGVDGEAAFEQLLAGLPE